MSSAACSGCSSVMRGCNSCSERCRRSANFVAPKLDATVFVFALVVSLATGFLFGAIPAFKASRASVAETLKEESSHSGEKPEKGYAGERSAGGPGRIFVSPAGDSGPVPAKHPAGLRYRSRLPDRASCRLHDKSGTGRVRKAADQGVLQGRPRARGEDSGRRVRIVGLEHAALGASREWIAGGRPAATIASRQNHNHRQHSRPQLFRDRRRGHRKRTRVYEYGPGDLRLRWPSSTRRWRTIIGRAEKR